MKNVLACCIVALCCVWVHGEGQNGVYVLTERSQGQLVYFFRQQTDPKRRGTVVRVPVMGIFQRLSADKATCVCTSLEGKEQQPWPVKELSVLPMTENVSDWELTTYVLAWLAPFDKDGAELESLAVPLLMWKGKERAISIREYLAAERRVLTAMERESEKLKSTRPSTQMKGVDRINDYLENNNSVIEVITTLADRGDFFAACSLIIRFNARFVKMLKEAGGERIARAHSTKWEENLLKAYVMARENGNGCEVAFETEFPTDRGLWNRAKPVTVAELGRLCRESYGCFLAARGQSPFCDFRQWGQNTLGILTLLPGDNEESSAIIAEFEAALKQYKDNARYFGR